VTPKASLAYRVSDRVMAYATLARGYRPGGTNFIPQRPTLKTYGPEYTTNYETGLKTSALGDRVQASLTGFRIRWTDQQVNAIDFTTFQGAIVTAGEVTSTGVELETRVIPLPGVLIAYDLGLIRARYDALNLSLDPSAPVSLAGNRQPYTPAATSRLAAEYAARVRALEAKADVTVGAQWRYLGKQYFDLENQIAQGGYGLLDAQMGLRVGGAAVSVWGKNLADKRFLAYGSAFGGDFVLPGDPRTWGVMLSTPVP
jgi:iron complex outermembrane receptor protein